MFFPCSDNTFWFKFIFNFISIVQKNEEAKRQIKLKKSTNKFDIRNFTELKDRCVKNFNLAAKIL
jgi:hypothetical protein